MSITYQASVYTRLVSYTNFKNETKEVRLYFALDPIQLLETIAALPTPKKTKSQNPAKQNETQDISEAQQIKLVRDLASKSAGFPSDDGESWEPMEDFGNTIAGQAFMTQMVSSDADRKEFSEKVLLDPFRAFVQFAEADTSNTPKEVQEMKQMLSQLENVFSEKPAPNETLEERRARLEADLAALKDSDG